MRKFALPLFLLLASAPSYACGCGVSGEAALLILGIGAAYLGGPPLVASLLFLTGRGMGMVRYLAAAAFAAAVGTAAGVGACVVGVWLAAAPVSVAVAWLVARGLAPARQAKSVGPAQPGFTPA